MDTSNSVGRVGDRFSVYAAVNVFPGPFSKTPDKHTALGHPKERSWIVWFCRHCGGQGPLPCLGVRVGEKGKGKRTCRGLSFAFLDCFLLLLFETRSGM